MTIHTRQKVICFQMSSIPEMKCGPSWAYLYVYCKALIVGGYFYLALLAVTHRQNITAKYSLQIKYLTVCWYPYCQNSTFEQ